MIGLIHQNASCAQQGAVRSETIPFQMHGMHIFVSAKMNGSPVNLVLDSGAGANVLTPATAERLGLKLEGGSIPVQGAGGAPVNVRMVTLTSVEVGKNKATQQQALVIPLPDALKCDGLLGTPFFRQWVVGIDFAKHTLTLTKPSTFKAPSSSEMSELPLTVISETVHISASADGNTGLFRVDTGASDSLTLFSKFVDKSRIAANYPNALTMMTGRGVGGLVYGDMVRMKKVDIGGVPFSGVAVTLSHQKQGAFADQRLAGNIGAELLQRFNVIFDEPHQKLYLSKGELYGRPFVGNRTGMAIDYVNGEFIVRSIIAGGPAAAAGIKEGDVITSIDGRDASSMNPWEPRDLFRSETVKKADLKVRTPGQQPREAAITLRDLL